MADGQVMTRYLQELTDDAFHIDWKSARRNNNDHILINSNIKYTKNITQKHANSHKTTAH